MFLQSGFSWRLIGQYVTIFVSIDAAVEHRYFEFCFALICNVMN